MVSSTPRPHFTPGKYLVPILQEAGWAPGPVWMGGKYRLHRKSIPDRPARSQSLYRLSYQAHYIYIKLGISFVQTTYDSVPIQTQTESHRLSLALLSTSIQNLTEIPSVLPTMEHCKEHDTSFKHAKSSLGNTTESVRNTTLLDYLKSCILNPASSQFEPRKRRTAVSPSVTVMGPVIISNRSIISRYRNFSCHKITYLPADGLDGYSNALFLCPRITGFELQLEHRLSCGGFAHSLGQISLNLL